MCSKIKNFQKQHSETIIYCLIICLMIIILTVFFEIDIPCGNITHHSILGLGMENNTIFASLEVGLLSFLATIYTNNRSMRLMRLSLTENTVKLKSKIDEELLSYRLYEQLKKHDEISTFLNIFDLIDKYDSEFKLIAPQSYETLKKFLTNRIDELDKNLTENRVCANLIILELISLSINRKEKKICLKEIPNFTELWDLTKFNNEFQYDANKENLKNIINNLNNENIKNETMAIFNEYCKLCEEIIDNLEKELKKFD